MKKLLICVFILNLLFRFIIEIFDYPIYQIFFILSRFILILFILFDFLQIRDNTFNYEILKSKKWLLCSLIITLICFISITIDLEKEILKKYFLFLVECISVGFLEELLFRYITFDYFLVRSKKYKYPIFLTSILFALFHISSLFFGSSLYSTINQIELAFIFALLLQFIFIKTSNLIIVSVLHALINFIGSHRYLEFNLSNNYFTFKEFIFNQLIIFLIYLIFIPIYLKILNRNNTY